MPLSPEEQQRITEEEQRRIEADAYRARVRQELLRRRREEKLHAVRDRLQRTSPKFWFYAGCALVLSLVVLSQFGIIPKLHLRRQTAAIPPDLPQPKWHDHAVYGGTDAPPRRSTTQAQSKNSQPYPQPANPETPTGPGGTPTSDPTKPNPASPQEPPADTATRSRTVAPDQSSGIVPPGIGDLLGRWQAGVRNRNISEIASCYAPVANVYFTKRDVSNADIRADKQRMFDKYPNISRYNIHDVDVESNNGNQAVVSLTKDWYATGNGTFAGSERERLTLAQISGEWKIVGEQETHVFWTHREK